MNHVYLSFPSLTSTNDYLKDHYSSLDNGTVVSTKHQTRGKGRLGRTWVDEEGALLFSFLLKGDEYESFLSFLPLLAGAAMEEALLDEGVETEIKWPNDIILNDKKCCGILLEAISDSKLQALVVGIGLNLNNESFPRELGSATSLYLETGKHYDKKSIMQKFLGHFDELLAKQKQGDSAYFTILKEHDYLKGKELLLNYYGENKHVTSLGINEKGALKVKNESGKTITVTSGEATIVKDQSLN